MKNIKMIYLVCISFMLIVHQTGFAQFSLGGYIFPNREAFADQGTPIGDINQFWDQVLSHDNISAAVTDANLSTWIMCTLSNLYLDVDFIDNVIVNDAGADFVIFERYSNEGYEVAVHTGSGFTSFIKYTGTQAIDLDDFSIAAGAEISKLRIRPNLLGGTEASSDIQDIGALHSKLVGAASEYGKFDFNDGTVQGWTVQGAFDEQENGPFSTNFIFGWKDPVNYSNPPGHDAMGDQNGSIQIFTMSGHGINNPGATWWVMQFHSPDLSSSADWQSASGYTVQIAECMATMTTIYANLFIRVFDKSQSKYCNFFNGAAYPLQHDVYGDASADWNRLVFDWSSMPDFPANYTVEEIYINIWGKMGGGHFEGGLYLDEVTSIPGGVQPGPAPPSNLDVHVLADQLHITWQDNSDNETGFKLEYKVSPSLNPDYSLLATLDANVTSYQMDNTALNHKYYFRVSAFNNEGQSARSNVDSASVLLMAVWIKIKVPNGGEVWSPGSTQEINWINSTLMAPTQVTIYYSLDGGSNWVTPPIAQNIPNTHSYNWTVPNTLSKNCLIKVQSATNASFYDLCNKPFTIGTAQVGPGWSFTSNTGNNATIILPTSANPNIDGTPLANGDYVGVFTPDGLCCGYSEWTGTNMPITAWGDNDQTVEVDGFKSGEQISYRIYQASTQNEFTHVQTEYSQGTNAYSANAILILSKFDAMTARTQMLAFIQGWNMFSMNVIPEDADIAAIMNPVVDRLVLVKNNAGQTYIPEYNINAIGNTGFDQGYQAYLKQAETLEVTGQPVEPQTPISLKAGWSMVSYLPDEPIDAQTALSSIADILVIAKSGDGLVYIPEYGINTIDTMRPGQGYQVYLKSDDVLMYPATARSALQKSAALSASTQIQHFTFTENTGENATVVIPRNIQPSCDDGTALRSGDEIGVFTSDGLCCGAAVWEGANTAIAVWGDDTQTPDIDGFLANDTLRTRLWRKTTNTEFFAKTTYLADNPCVYKVNGFTVLSSLKGGLFTSVQNNTEQTLPAEFNLFQNYPNPFNSMTAIEFTLPRECRVTLTVYNYAGEPVAVLIDRILKADRHKVNLNARNWASGVYFVKLKAGRFMQTRKLLFLK